MTRRAWGLLCLFVIFALAAPFVHAGSLTTVARTGLTGWAPVAGGGYQRVVSAFSDPVTARIWAAASGGAVSATETAAITAVRGPLAVSSSLSISAGEAAGLIGRCLGSPVCVAASAAAIAIAQEYRAKPEPAVVSPSAPNPSNTVQWDPGSPATQVACSGINGPHTGDKCRQLDDWCTVLTADNYVAYGYNGSGWGQSHVATDLGGGQWRCVGQVVIGTGSSTFFTATQSVETSTQARCIPSEVDGLPNTPGFDGKCRSGAYSHTLITDMIPKFGSFPSVGSDGKASPNWKQAAQDAVESGGQSAPGTITTTGPASQTGTPTTSTTTGPSGTTTTTTTPSTSYVYDGDTITYNSTSVSVVNNGSTTTTTTTTNPPTDSKDPCDANPTRAGCSLLGTPATDAPAWVEKPVSYAPVDMPLGSCPADQSFTFHTWALPLHWQPACDAAPVVKIGLLLCASLAAAGFIVRSVTA